MNPVAVRILHPPSSLGSGPLARWLADARLANAEGLAARFAEAGATDIRIDGDPSDERPFGLRLKALAAAIAPAGGLVVLGSGSIPLATVRDLADLLAVAGSGGRRALTNNRYSADVIALGHLDALAELPDLPADNALPRWLEEVAGFDVRDRRGRWRLGIDLDSPLDVLLIDRFGGASGGASRRATPNGDGIDLGLVLEHIDRIRALAADRRAELVVAGRTNGATLRWLERCTACRIRALVEERGLRASAPAAMAHDVGTHANHAGVAAGGMAASLTEATASRRRPPRSVLGMLLDHRGASAFGSIVAELGDGAIVDTRVLLAHRLGTDEIRWPSAEDRFASDLLLAEGIEEPWLRVLTRSMRDAPVPIVPGGHTLVGPGIRLLLG